MAVVTVPIISGGSSVGKVELRAIGCGVSVTDNTGERTFIPSGAAHIFPSISSLTINYATGERQAVCTWAPWSTVVSVEGEKNSDGSMSISGQDADDDVPPTVLRFAGNTVVSVVSESSSLIPVYYGIDSSVSSYKLGISESKFSWITKDKLSPWEYGVEYEERGHNELRVFGVIPHAPGPTQAFLTLNNSASIHYPNWQDEPIPIDSDYSNGQTITAAYSARWVNVSCSQGPNREYYATTDDSAGVKFDTTYIPRLTVPTNDNPYYKQRAYGGYSPCCEGNDKYGLRPYSGSVLPNCVGYACGRFNEIGGYDSCKELGGPNAEDFIYYYGSKLGVSQTPSLGACAVWRVGNIRNSDDGCGHVAIVEEIYPDGSILTSESGWSARKSLVWTEHRNNSDGNWSQGSGYVFLGFIKNPAVKFSGLWNSDEDPSSFANQAGPGGATGAWSGPEIPDDSGRAGDGPVYQYDRELIGSVGNIRGLQLLTTPTLVESPFIEVKIGDYTFGSYTREGSMERALSTARVTYPNYMESLRITKVNGAVNQYVLSMNYKIQAGDDPNLIDKIFSSVSNSRKIKLTYGDWNSPSFIYRDEEALITKVDSNVNFQQSLISYTVYCTSSAVPLKSKVYDFGGYQSAKPSDVILDLLFNKPIYGLQKIFYGMSSEELVLSKGLIPTDDKAVNIKAQKDIDIVSYLNYLVACMASNTANENFIKDATYHLILRDDVSGEVEGPYFKIVKINTTANSLVLRNAYEVDVGFPDNTLVMNFQINNNNAWAILYNYARTENLEQYTYKIDNQGNMVMDRSPNVMTSNVYKETTEASKTWWTQMTQFPITATLTIKGILRPVMLMEYVKVNAVFYGQRHISSGLYVITKQEDDIGKGGYKTTLSLLRVAGDEDSLYDVKQTDIISDNSSDSTNTEGTQRTISVKDAVEVKKNNPRALTTYDILHNQNYIWSKPSSIQDPSVGGYTGFRVGGGFTGPSGSDRTVHFDGPPSSFHRGEQ